MRNTGCSVDTHSSVGRSRTVDTSHARFFIHIFGETAGSCARLTFL